MVLNCAKLILNMDLHRSIVLLVLVLSTYFSLANSRQHPVRHAHSRHKRQQRLQQQQQSSGFLPGSFIVDGPGGPEYGDWGPWSEPSECSRTCGGGVAFQTRQCREVRSDGASSCRGGSKRYFSCNIQDCPGNTDFRGEQCGEYNRVPFENKFYEWIPYTKAPNRCELNCMPRGERFYYRHKRKVIDGTRCDEEKLDVCVDGQCLPVGCDMMLGSEAREDNCRECGGDGSSCTRVDGVLDNRDLQVGYNDILLIPAGATNIRVQEAAPSNNYLAIRNASNHFYLNGNWRIDFPRSLHFCGTIFHYERKPHGFYAPDSITALGPTNEAIYLVILYQEAGPSVTYEYSVPKGVSLSRDPDSYAWVADDFGDCSATCGGGVQQRSVTCIRRRDMVRVLNHLCDSASEPPLTQACSTDPCPPQWTTDPWSGCSESCSRGTKERQVYCTQIIANGLPSVINETQCTEQLGQKPETKQECNADVICPTWHIGPWKPCDTLCDAGSQRRDVRCYRKVDDKIEVLPDSACPDEKPETEKSCMLKPCDGVDWITSEWSTCDDSCGLTQQTRSVQCATQSGIVFPDSFCHEYRIPELVKECENPKKCEHEWYAGQWSKCSSKCGAGVQTRKVFCGATEEETIKKVDEDKCDAELKYEAEQNCTGEEVCKGDWFTGPWSQCSKECGGGEMTRKVLCLLENTTVDITNCDSNSIPFSSESCNMVTCGEDEVSPISPTHDLSEVEDEDCEEDYDDYDDEEEEASSVIISKTTLGLDEISESSSESSKVSDSSPEGTSETKSSETTSSADATSSDVTTSDQATQSSLSVSSEEAVSGGSTSSESESSRSSRQVDGSTTPKPKVLSDGVDYDDDISLGPSATSVESGASSSEIETTTEIESTTTSDEETSGALTTLISIVSSLMSSESPPTTTSDQTDTTENLTTSSDISSSESSSSSSESTSEADLASSSEAPLASSTIERSSIVDSSAAASTVDETTLEQSGTSSSEAESDVTVAVSEATGDGSSESIGSGATDATTEGVSGSTDSVTDASTDIGSSVSPIGLTTESSTDLTDETGASEASSVASWGTTDVTDLWGSSVSSIQLAITKEQKLKKCKKRKRSPCKDSEFGCCFDGKTSAKGPFHKGCPHPKTCKDAPHGCCSDGVSPAKGKNERGCPKSICKQTLFGCCQDGVSIAEGNDYEGCPEPTLLPVVCKTTQFGCCPDKVTPATGPKNAGCFVCEGSGECDSCEDTKHGCCPDGLRAASGDNFAGCEEGSGFGNETLIDEDCKKSRWGCCPDGIISAEGPNFENCGESENCTLSEFGCCPDGITSAVNGCRMSCEDDPFGCCPDKVTPAHGNNGEGCCLNSVHGCCPDNIIEARGPNFEGCNCESTPFGCCPDNITAARGSNNEGCGCAHTQHGCCPNKYTPAGGPEFQGCPCYTFQFGCCPDGVTVAKGPQRLGCGCENTEFKCCPDGKTPANSSDHSDCGCAASKYGCCPDGISDAQGEKFEGCSDVPFNAGESCKKEKDRGSCRDFTVKWFFDMEYGGCSRFWYGGCEGNENRFRNQEDCQKTCVAPEGKARCNLPKVTGPCEGYYPKWYYDTERKQCGQFIYGGCLGNNNNFETREECEQLCGASDRSDVCEQDKEEGPCSGNYTRFYFDKDTKSCQEFEYGGCKANGNNFLTESACVEQCLQPGRQKDHCSLPRDAGNCAERLPKWFFDYSENRCMPFYYSGCGGNKNNFESLEACEGDCPPRIEQDICTQPALVGECHNYTERWYFDAISSRCAPFYYGGCGGNQNNFVNQDACQSRCVARQQPPPPAEEFRVEYCLYPGDAGDCTDSRPFWHYDRADGACKQFLYGGCGGNPNRFASRQECEQRCFHAQDVCTLPKTVGPCNGNYQQWFYDRQTDTCYEFDYGGCQGNANRFNTQHDCEARCRQAPAPEQTPPPTQVQTRDQYLPHTCTLPVQPGDCQEERTAWYFDYQNRKCQAFTFSGCNGNGNIFETEEQCERQCGDFRGQDVCRLPSEVGPCRAAIAKWYFNERSHTCEQFTYGGCRGNGNRFTTVQECENICLHKEERLPESDRAHEDVCLLPPDAGSCYHSLPRWFFNETARTCIPMIYSGCGGNFNNFKEFDTCLKYCIPQLRPEDAIKDPNEIDVDACSDAREECTQLQCPYGVEKYVDSNNCERCKCHDPCREHSCPEAARCAIEFYRTPDGEVQHRPVCREENKPGECPTLAVGSGSCTQECYTDADCQDDNKCCRTECGASCVKPATEATRAPEPQPRPYPSAGNQPPRIQGDDPQVTAEEGSHVTLRCAVSGSPRPIVTWKKGTIIIDGSGGRHRFLADGSLQIIGLYRSDAGVYVCAADNGIGRPAQREYRLDITDPTPRQAEVIGEESTSVVVSLGAPAILQCYAVGWPRPYVTWWRGDRMLPLSSTQFEQRRDYSLLIRSVVLRNLGPYTCQAYNGKGKAASWTVQLQAIGPIYSNTQEDEIYLQYIVTAPQTPDMDRPRLPGPALPPPVPRPTSRPFPLLTTTPPHREPDIEPPRVYIVPVTVRIPLDRTVFAVGSDVSVPCDVDGYPIPRVTWYKDGHILDPSERIQISESQRLLILRANSSDSGTYRCEAANHYSSATADTFIAVEGIYVHPNCTDNPFFADCKLIVKAKYCTHKYYAKFCCKSCTEAGQLPTYGPHLEQNRRRK